MDASVALGVVGTVSGLSGLAIALYQTRLSRRAATLQVILDLHRSYQSAEMRATRGKIYRREYGDYADLPLSDQEDIRNLLNLLELLGTLVDERIADFHVVHSLWRKSPRPIWYALVDSWVKHQREAGIPTPQPDYAQNFERLVKRYEQERRP